MDTESASNVEGERPNWTGMKHEDDQQSENLSGTAAIQKSPDDCTQTDDEVIILEDDMDGTYNQIQQMETLPTTVHITEQESADEDCILVTSENINSNRIGRPTTGDANPGKTYCKRQDCFNLVTSLIDEDADLQTIRAFAAVFSGTFCGKNSLVTMDTTHLIMKPDDKNRVRHTFKYLKAIVLHKPVVSLDWIQKSLRCGYPLPVERYLVYGENGENAVELSLKNADSIIFQNISVLLLDSVFSNLNPRSIEELLVAGGACVFNKELFSIMPRILYKVVVVEMEITEDMCRENCKRYSALTLPWTWILDSITQYKLAPWQPYLSHMARRRILYDCCVFEEEPLYISSDDEEDERKPLKINHDI